LVLGRAKVISYEDLEKARAKRVVKDAAKEAKGKGKRGRKRKSGTPEAEAEAEEPEPELSAKIARTSKAPAPSRALVMQTPIMEDEIVLELWRAPVAKMW
jgi:hypothetical protein